MLNYPIEKNITRFYKYKFIGYDTPIIIEAYNKLEARQKLAYFLEKYPQYQGIQVISESLSLPIYGETIKEIDGLENVWIGEPVKWMPLNEFLNLNEK